MHRRLVPLSIFCFLLCLLVLPAPARVSAQDRHFLWRVQSNDGSGFILGSIHMLKEEHYPLSRIIENAFEQSDTLVVEANVNEADQALIQKIRADAFYPPGDSLENHVAPETLALAQKKADEIGLDFQFIKRQKPWFLALTLPSMALTKAGYDPQCGIDMYFLSRARGKKKIIELESLDFQMKLLSGFNASQQELLLIYTLEDLTIASAEADRLVEAWQTGDTREMEDLTVRSFKGDPRLEAVFRSLILERNRAMADRIERILRTADNCLFVVGAAHLVGKEGILNILKTRGWKIDQL